MKVLCPLITSLSTVVLVSCLGAWLVLSLPATGWQVLAVPTSSMRPTISPGSAVLVHRVPVALLHVGDIITYTDPHDVRRTITHRIVSMYLIGGTVRGYITKGDANKQADIPITSGSIRGEVVASVPNIGLFMNGARSWVSLAVCVYLPALLVSVDELRRLSAYYRMLLPYRLTGYQRHAIQTGRTFAAVPIAAIVLFVLVIGLWQPTVAALLSSNMVRLTGNRITVDRVSNCHSANNSNMVTIGTTSSQAASSGAASGSSASSGAASNSDSTTVTVVITNGC